MNSIKKLLSLGGSSLNVGDPKIGDLSDIYGEEAKVLESLLQIKNGFYAFESALHLLSSRACEADIGLDIWNSAGLWKGEYQGLADGFLFFAEDIFGLQFGISKDGISQFDPETGAATVIAGDLDGWACALLRDYDFLTGYSIAHSWQMANGPLAPGLRLVPKVPFVAGGKYELDNLYSLEAVKSMKLRADLAVRIRDLPDGATIRYKPGD
ncbi:MULTISPECIES: hypothetical protein [unclassified Bradyrhizobium]|uniref:hypothetical protein n=1 Tax=unclassified Bradyrhizobium TaxID=2631580 RepID=UPI0028E67174|nr:MULTISPECIES: hypothetical protein [unclassified Bradyrhizobium]